MAKRKRSKKIKKTASQVGKFSRAKGKRLEREMARYFTKWTGLKWECSRNSGRTDVKGDVYCVEYPDLPMIVECKHRMEYSVHAMLKPTKAFTDMLKESRDKISENQFMVFIVKNETGIWIAGGNLKAYSTGGEAIESCGLTWVKIENITDEFNIEEIHFGKK